MQLSIRVIFSAAVLLASVPALALHPTHTSRSTHATISHSRRAAARPGRVVHSGRATHGHAAAAHHSEAHVAMDTERATEIQTALIKRGYLTGEPTGTWDSASIAAMQKLQSDNGWQTKIMPDSRALIKLGLGPNSQSAPQ